MEIHESAFGFEIDRVVDKIEERGCDKVGLQFPQGLKRRATTVVDTLEERTDARLYVSGDPCYGACDLDEWLMRNTDMLVHFGHSPIKDSDDVLYVESRSDAPIEEVTLEAADTLDPDEPVCLVTTAQHSHVFEEARDLLKDQGFEVVSSGGGSRLNNEGQVLAVITRACPRRGAGSLSRRRRLPPRRTRYGPP